MADKKEKNIENIYKEMWKISLKMDDLKLTNLFDVDQMLSALNHQLDQLNYFYCNLVQKQDNKDPNKTYYNLKTTPKKHQLIYVSLGRGYPKELFDGHWCYVVKDCGTKLLIIPTTSLKENSSTEEQDYYFDIKETAGNICRLRIDEIRVIDKMRVVQYKGYRDISTDRNEVEERIMNFLKFTDKIVDKKENV